MKNQRVAGAITPRKMNGTQARDVWARAKARAYECINDPAGDKADASLNGKGKAPEVTASVLAVSSASTAMLDHPGGDAPPPPSPSSFSLPSFLRWLQRLFFPPLNDDDLKKKSASTRSTQPGTSASSEHQYNCQHSNDAGQRVRGTAQNLSVRRTTCSIPWGGEAHDRQPAGERKSA